LGTCLHSSGDPSLRHSVFCAFHNSGQIVIGPTHIQFCDKCLKKQRAESPSHPLNMSRTLRYGVEYQNVWSQWHPRWCQFCHLLVLARQLLIASAGLHQDNLGHACQVGAIVQVFNDVVLNVVVFVTGLHGCTIHSAHGWR
jgi:hypothetical protein